MGGNRDREAGGWEGSGGEGEAGRETKWTGGKGIQ